MKTIEERFWEKVIVDEPDKCWIWSASKKQNGYGQIGSFANGKFKSLYAHRLSWEIENKKEIPMNMEILHLCDNPPCVNPNHLLLGTHADNMNDMSNKGRGTKILSSAESDTILKEYQNTKTSIRKLASKHGVGRSVVYRIVSS